MRYSNIIELVFLQLTTFRYFKQETAHVRALPPISPRKCKVISQADRRGELYTHIHEHINSRIGQNPAGISRVRSRALDTLVT